MLEWYQHLPQSINPIVFSVGFFSLRWYAVMYMVAILISIFSLWRLLRGTFPFELYLDLISALLIGALIGARIGYILFYYPSFYLENPLAIMWPFDMQTKEWIGIAGMSYFGGLIGVVLALYLFCKRHVLTFWKIADTLALCVPLAYFFGRIGNFLNGELYGRVTHSAWGMYFLDASGNMVLRYPSQLFEAFFEGVILFFVAYGMWYYQKRHSVEKRIYGFVALAYIIGYSIFRFALEFIREPDIQTSLLFNWMSFGQIYALIVLVFGCIILYQKIRVIRRYLVS